MIVPCMVNSWLYCSGVRNCMPGCASSARMNSAIRPPIMNQLNDVVMYMTPSTLGSVVCRYDRNFEPRGGRCTGYGRATTGRGATAVTVEPPAVRRTRGVLHTPLSWRDQMSLIRRGVELCARGGLLFGPRSAQGQQRVNGGSTEGPRRVNGGSTEGQRHLGGTAPIHRPVALGHSRHRPTLVEWTTV